MSYKADEGNMTLQLVFGSYIEDLIFQDFILVAPRVCRFTYCVFYDERTRVTATETS